MQHVTNLSTLLAFHLERLLTSEHLQYSRLPKMAAKAHSLQLQKSIKDYRATKEENTDRLEQCVKLLNLPRHSVKCAVVESLIDDCQASVSNAAEKHVADAEMISAIQQINHFNITNYGTAASFAKTLKKEQVAKLLHDALVDEKEYDISLSQIAEQTINPAAALASSSH